eukprot:scaffold44882_cov18-Tisochrysis_lutea.AAC.4
MEHVPVTIPPFGDCNFAASHFCTVGSSVSNALNAKGVAELRTERVDRLTGCDVALLTRLRPQAKSGRPVIRINALLALLSQRAPAASLLREREGGFQGSLVAEGTAGSGGGADGVGHDEGKEGVKATEGEDANRQDAGEKSQKEGEGGEDSDDAKGEAKEGDSDE